MTGDDLDAWCRRQLGAAPVLTRFETGHLSRVVGVTLEDGRDVVVKIRPPSPRIGACFSVQRHLHDRGFPCAAPLAGPAPFGADHLIATAEAYVPPHGPPPATIDAAPVAHLLADLVDLAPPPATQPALRAPPPWAGWDHDDDPLWPWPDDLDVDMNDHAGPVHVDDVARRVRDRLAAAHTATDDVIGHVDWEAHNIDWDGARPALVHDWDSLAIRREPTLAGLAAATFPTHAGHVAATVEETDAFLDIYRSRRPTWTDDDIATAWTAGLWVLTYNAKKESLGAGPGYLAQLDRELDERVRRARL